MTTNAIVSITLPQNINALCMPPAGETCQCLSAMRVEPARLSPLQFLRCANLTENPLLVERQRQLDDPALCADVDVRLYRSLHDAAHCFMSVTAGPMPDARDQFRKHLHGGAAEHDSPEDAAACAFSGPILDRLLLRDDSTAEYDYTYGWFVLNNAYGRRRAKPIARRILRSALITLYRAWPSVEALALSVFQRSAQDGAVTGTAAQAPVEHDYDAMARQISKFSRGPRRLIERVGPAVIDAWRNTAHTELSGEGRLCSQGLKRFDEIPRKVGQRCPWT